MQQIKIGSASQVILGPQHYEIKYRVNNALIRENDLVQFYWNVKPADWLTTFYKVEFRIHAPDGSLLSPGNSFTYSGRSGNSEVSDEFNYTYADGVYSGVSQPDFTSTVGESVTVLVKLPASLFTEIPAWKKWTARYGWIGILGIILLLFGMSYLINGRNKKLLRFTSYYPPESMDPAMAGMLMDKQGFWTTRNNINALLPYWGSEGLITIEEAPRKGWFGKTDFLLTKQKDLPEQAHSYQKKLFNKIFEGTEKDTKTPNGVYLQSTALRQRLSGVYLQAFWDLGKQAKKYLDIPARRRMRATSCLVVIAAFALSAFFLFTYGILAALISFFTLIYLGKKGWTSKKRNEKGNNVMNELTGFYQFIKKAEINRIRVLLKEDPNYFEKTMPYAMAFGLLQEWAKRFNGLDIAQPDWYKSSTSSSLSGMSNQFSTGAFVSSMTVATQIFSNATISSTSGSGSSHSSSSPSSGGGSSGGGFGGGGGSSW